MMKRIVPRTPVKCVQAYQHAVAFHDWEKCWALLSKSSQDSWKARAKDFQRAYSDTAHRDEIARMTRELADMGYTPTQGHEITGPMLMVGTCKTQFKANPDGFRAFAEAKCTDYKQMERSALIDVRLEGQSSPQHAMAEQHGFLWHLLLPYPNVIPTTPAPSPPPPANPAHH